MRPQRGGFALGLVVGLLVGLVLALGVALYITKAPVPFIDKVPQRTAEQDQAEAARNRNWDPNAALGGAAAQRAASAAQAGALPAAAFIFFVQAGAFTRAEDAEQQKARLAMGGWAARVSEREQAGRTVWRVRIGPYGTRAEADAQQQKLVDAGIEAQIVRVEKP